MKILDKSLEIAFKLFNNELRTPQVSCFIYDGNKLLSIGQNDMRTESPKALYFGKRYKLNHLVRFPYVHAEVDAISKLWGKFKITGKEKIVVVRLKRAGTEAEARKVIMPGLAKPCRDCSAILSSLNLAKCWYTTNDSDRIFEEFS